MPLPLARKRLHVSAKSDAILSGNFFSPMYPNLPHQLQTKWITPEVLSDWQKQALLMCQVEKMTAVGATLLVIAGIDSAEQLATWESQSLKRRIDEAATTTVGKRVLRDQAPPTLERLSHWTDSARRSYR